MKASFPLPGLEKRSRPVYCVWVCAQLGPLLYWTPAGRSRKLSEYLYLPPLQQYGAVNEPVHQDFTVTNLKTSQGSIKGSLHLYYFFIFLVLPIFHLKLLFGRELKFKTISRKVGTSYPQGLRSILESQPPISLRLSQIHTNTVETEIRSVHDVWFSGAREEKGCDGVGLHQSPHVWRYHWCPWFLTINNNRKAFFNFLKKVAN